MSVLHDFSIERRWTFALKAHEPLLIARDQADRTMLYVAVLEATEHVWLTLGEPEEAMADGIPLGPPSPVAHWKYAGGAWPQQCGFCCHGGPDGYTGPVVALSEADARVVVEPRTDPHCWPRVALVPYEEARS